MVRQIRKVINDPESKTVNDTEITRFLNEAQDKIYTLFDRWWFLYKKGTVIDTVASQKIYNLPSDFGRMSRVTYRYVSGSTDTTYNLKYLPNVEFEYEYRDNTADDDDNVKHYSIYPGDSTNETGYLHIGPTPATAGLDMTPWYYKTMTSLDSYADETDVPIPSILEDYALSQIYQIRAEETNADRYDKIFREQIELLKMMQKKQVGSLRTLWRYQGPDAEERLYGGTQSVGRDVEKDW
jgi:hypothetical protein